MPDAAGAVNTASMQAALERGTQALQGELYDMLVAAGLQGLEIGEAYVIGLGLALEPLAAEMAIREWASTYAYNLVRGINATSRAALQSAVTRWVSNGQPLDKLVEELSPIFGEKRASIIASTEVTRSFARGSQAAWEQSQNEIGVQWVQIWNTANDEIVQNCPICYPMNGVTAPLGQKFIHPGGLGAFEAPPAHPRCILPGNEIVTPGPILAAAKSFYSGPCVEIALSGGCRLTVTHNHPVLTPKGWIAAQFIREGDYVIYAADAERIAASIEPDYDHRPTVVEEMFDALMKSGFVASRGVPVSPEDLHGDGGFVNGNVDIIYPDGFLLRDLKTRLLKAIGQHCLGLDYRRAGSFPAFSHAATLVPGDGPATGGGVSSRYLEHPLLGSHLSPFGGFGFRLIAGGDPGPNQARTESTTIDTRLTRQFILRFASEIPLDKYIEAGNNLAIMPSFGRPGTRDVGLVGAPEKCIHANPRLLYQGGDRLAGLITPKQVVKVGNFDFSGHVYDFQCDLYELYICNGVVVKNCRCWLTAVPAESLTNA